MGMMLKRVTPKATALESVRAEVMDKIDAWTRTAIIGGFVSSANGSPHTYDSDDNDQDNLKLMQAVAQLPGLPRTPGGAGHRAGLHRT